MKLFTLFVGLSTIAYTAAIFVEVQPGAAPIALYPRNANGQTRYDLRTVVGSKLILLCRFGVNYCLIGSIIVRDGEFTTKYCPEETPTFVSNSLGHEMTVAINNQHRMMASYCQVHATTPFTQMNEPRIDSREHGLLSKSKKANTCKCGWTNKVPGRVVGGRDTAVNEYSFPVILMFTETQIPFCGGSIITPYHVLTAAHCTNPFKKESLSVVVGDHDISTMQDTPYAQVHVVRRIFEHAGYEPVSVRNDISILELGTKIQFNEVVGPVCMPTRQQNLKGEFIKVLGWGMTEDPLRNGESSLTLKKVYMKVLEPEICQSVFFHFTTTPLTQICTYNFRKGSCRGDSGGPLIHLNSQTNTYYQVGLVSYGQICGSSDPSANTDVAYFLNWIKEQLAKSQHKVDLCY